MSILEVKDLNFSYEGNKVLSDINFSLGQSEILCILGPSGCGKTTLLQCISGFEKISNGEIIYDGKVVSTISNTTPPEKRKMALVFQDYALFPHMNVKENILFALRKKDTNEKKKICSEVLDLVGLKSKTESFPHELSGGEQQRVAIARAIATGCDLILFDEPFSNLDLGLRKKLRMELRSILKKAKVSAIFITHDQNEAYDIADRIAILGNSKVEQIGTAFEIYQKPKNKFVANFLGSRNIIKAKYNKEEKAFECPLFSKQIDIDLKQDDDIYFYIPSDAIRTDSCELNGHQFSIGSKQFRGDHYHLKLVSKNTEINMSLPTSSYELIKEDRICLYFDLSKIILITD